MTKVDRDTIVVGVDSSTCSDRAVDWAVEEAKRSGRRLLLVHVWHWTSAAVESPMSLVEHHGPHAAGRNVLANVAKRVKAQDVPVTTMMAEGSAAHALGDIARDGAMLVVGHHGHSAVHRTLIGSVSRGCLERCSVPVVVVPAACA